MSSNCPPQLQLSIQPNTTSFKRSFEQFGFDLESPVAGGITDAGASGATNNPGNERNKRARSASSFDSESSSDLSAASISSGSTSFSSQASGVSVLSALVEPPRLPTPQLQDVDMEEEDSFSPPGAMHPVSPPQTHAQDEGDAQHGEQRYRLALERFDLFDREISILRQPEATSSVSTLTSSTSVAGAPSTPGNLHSRLSPTPAPTLPPLHMNRHRLSPSDIAFLHRTSPLAAPWHENEQGPMPRDSSDQSRQHAHHTTFTTSSSPSDAQVIPARDSSFTNQNGPFRYLYRIEDPLPLSMPTLDLDLNLGGSIAAETSERSPSSSSSFLSSIHSPPAPISGANDLGAESARFRERLDTALERLRSPSPLVPGLRVDDEHSDEQDGGESPQASDGDDDEEENEPVSRTDTHISAAAPILPPIPPIADDLPTAIALNITTNATGSAVDQYVETRMPNQRHTRSSPPIAPSPPTLPAIPPITASIDTIERAWDGRAELFTDNFDEFMGLGSASVSPSTSTAPGLAFERETEINLNFGDGPSIPSPILRDLRSWMDDRQPLIPAEDNQSISSISTTAATAGTERDTTRERWTSTVTMPTAGPSSPSPPPSSASNVVREPRLDPLGEQLERIRGGRLGSDGWLPDIHSPSAPTSSWSVSARPSTFNSHAQQRNPPPLHTDRDLLHLSDVYDETSPTLSESPPSLSRDAFWAPLFAATDEAPRAVTPSVRPLYPARLRSFSRPAVGTTDQDFGLSTGHDGPPVGTSDHRFSGIIEYRPRVVGSSVATIARSVEDRSRNRRDSTGADGDTMEVSGIPQPTSSSNPSSNVNHNGGPLNRDHMSYNSIMHDLSQPPALNLGPTSNVQSSRLLTTSDQAAQPTSAGLAQTRERLTQERVVFGRAAERISEHERRIFAELGRIDGTPHEPAASELWGDARLAMNNLFTSSGNYHRPRSPSRSSLSNWDGRSAARPNPRSQSESPTRVFSFHSSTNSSAPFPPSRAGLSPEASREEPNIRNRLRPQHAHTRPGASNSLVAENASEVRRRADLEALNGGISTRQYPTRDEDGSRSLAGDVRASSYETSWHGWRHDLRRSSQAYSQAHDGPSDISIASIDSSTPSSHLPASSSVTANTVDEHMDVFDSGDGLVPLPSLGTFINTMPLDTSSNNAGGSAASPTGSNFPILGPYWMNHSTRLASSSYPSPGNSSISDNSPTSPQRVDTMPSTSTLNERRPSDGNNRQYNIPGAGASSTQRYQSDAPSLPHPDLGGAFNAHRHQRSTSSQWRPTEDAPVDVIMEEAPQTANSFDRANADNEMTSSPELDGSARPLRLQQTFMRDRQTEVSRVRERLHRNQAIQQHTMDRNVARNNATAIAATATSLTTSTPTEPLVPRRIMPQDIFVPRATIGPSQRRNPSATPALPAYFDPETFTPGPFRNTMQQYVNEREGRGDSIAGARPRPRTTTQPPSIPPLPFAADGGTTTQSTPHSDSDEEMLTGTSFLAIQARQARERRARANEAYSFGSHLMPHARYAPRSRSAAVHEFEARLPGLSSATPTNESDTNDTAARRNSNSREAAQPGERIDSVYQYVTQRARMEALAEQSPAGSLPLPPRGPYSQMLGLRENNADRRRPDPADRPPTSADTHLSRARRTSGLFFDSMGMHIHPRPGGNAGESSASAATSSADDDDDMTGGEAAQRTRNRRRFTRNPHAEMPFALAHAHATGAFMGGMRRGRPLSDYIRDEEFDESYEGLLTLAETLGEAKPRATPSEILEKMEKATYKDWATEESDTRCPICLDDYEQTDLVLKLPNCSHWLHQGCLNQWLQSANTCPVCRCSVGSSSSPRTGPAARMPRYRGGPFAFMARRREPLPVPASVRPEASIQRQFRGGRPQPGLAQAHGQAHGQVQEERVRAGARALQAHMHILRNAPPTTAPVSAPTSPATSTFPAYGLNSRRPRDRSDSGSGSSTFEVPWRREPGPH